VQRFLARLLGEVESVMHALEARLARQTDWPVTVHALVAVPPDHVAQRCSRHDVVHRRPERFALHAITERLGARTLIGRHRNGVLLHRSITHHVNRREPFRCIRLPTHRHQYRAHGFNVNFGAVCW
jgi:hypothetical protein